MLLLKVICLPTGELEMKRTWNTPELTVYGPVQEITQKVIGIGDAIIFDSREGGGGGDDDGPAGGSL